MSLNLAALPASYRPFNAPTPRHPPNSPRGKGQRMGRYEVVRKIASGGMADILLAQQTGEAGFSKQVVIKRLSVTCQQQPSQVRMFLDEARLLAVLNHPNVAQVLHLGRHNGRYYSVLEHIDGPDLRGFLVAHQRTGDLPQIALVVHIVAHVAAGLQAAHSYCDPLTGVSRGIIHRDVSPENVVLSAHGAVKVIDFGAAHHDGREPITRCGHVRGKVGYIAPERVMEQPYDHRADIFSVGVLLMEMITGRNPFRADTPLESLQRTVQLAAPSLRSLGVAPGAELEDIVQRCLAKDPSERFADAGKLAVALRGWLWASGHKVGQQEITVALRRVSKSDRRAPANVTPPPRRWKPPATDANAEPPHANAPTLPLQTPQSTPLTAPLAPPRLGSGTATPHDVRASTSLPGRVDERTVPNQPVRSRLVTVAGPPTFDRTRTAMRACRVLLATSSASELLWVRGKTVRTVADLRAGLVEQLKNCSPTASVETLQRCLKDRPLVVLLDDVDQVVGVNAMIAELLHSTERLRVVCTNAAAIGVEGEKVITVLTTVTKRNAK